VASVQEALQQSKTSWLMPIEGGTVEDLQSLIDGQQRFGTIYADPPWRYGNQATRAATGKHYKTMTLEQIAELPVNALVTDNAHLHLWTTNAFLFDAQKIIEAWGFKYKSCFVWVKTQMGIGNYWRVSHEFLLLGTRGRATFTLKNQKSWGEFRRGKHSEKPDQVRQTVELVSPGPRLELFARKATPGWWCWGKEISRDLFSAGLTPK